MKRLPIILILLCALGYAQTVVVGSSSLPAAGAAGACLVSSETGNWVRGACSGTASGTVTNTGGALTATNVMVGNGGNDAKASAATVDADGKGTFPGGVVAGEGSYKFTGSGSNAAGVIHDDGAGNMTSGKVTSSDIDATVAAASHTQAFSTITARPWSCQTGIGDGLNAVTAGTYLQSFCYNDTGATVTLSGLKCYSDNAGTSTMAVTNGAGTALLTGAVTCSTAFAAGTQGTTTTLANGDFLKFTFVADGTSKQTTWVVTGSY